MLVQPALTTHLFCRPVSTADSTGLRGELQVLCERLRCVTVWSPVVREQDNKQWAPARRSISRRERPFYFLLLRRRMPDLSVRPLEEILHIWRVRVATV